MVDIGDAHQFDNCVKSWELTAVSTLSVAMWKLK